MPPQPELRVLVTTFSKEEEAAEIVRTLVRDQLVACGTLIRGARSIYVWQGNMEDSDEIVVIFKTTTAEAAAARLKELHPYEVPEILVLTPESANAAYTRWVADACASK
ncbi:MAG: divalent-cation tolerance protein CutA [Chthoniobacterales bacterium]